MTSMRSQYAHCPPREPAIHEVNEDTIKHISSKCRVTPLYETGIFEYVYRKHYSLQRNKNLSCAWQTYKQNAETRVLAPFQFPDQRDMHFYNGAIRFLPELTDFKRGDFRKCLKPGPGVDACGQMPIPNELHMRRNAPVKETKEKKKKAAKGVKITKDEKNSEDEKFSKSEKASKDVKHSKANKTPSAEKSEKTEEKTKTETPKVEKASK